MYGGMLCFVNNMNNDACRFYDNKKQTTHKRQTAQFIVLSYDSKKRSIDFDLRIQ